MLSLLELGQQLCVMFLVSQVCLIYQDRGGLLVDKYILVVDLKRAVVHLRHLGCVLVPAIFRGVRVVLLAILCHIDDVRY